MKHAFPKKTGKTIIWNPTLSTNPPIFSCPPLCPNFKNKTPPNFRRQEGNYVVIEVNGHECDLMICFLHLHGHRETLSWLSAADKCFVPTPNILCIITAPATITGQMYQMTDTDFEQSLKAYQNHKMYPCIYKVIVHILSFLSLEINGFFF